MNNEIEYEYKRFLDEIENSNKPFLFGQYLDELDYEDSYSGDEIYSAQELLKEKIHEYLHVHHPGKYIVSNGYCVIVMTPEEATKRRVLNCMINDFIVN